MADACAVLYGLLVAFGKNLDGYLALRWDLASASNWALLALCAQGVELDHPYRTGLLKAL